MPEKKSKTRFLTAEEFAARLERYTKDDYEHPHQDPDPELDALYEKAEKPPTMTQEFDYLFRIDGKLVEYPGDPKTHTDADPYWFLLDCSQGKEEKFREYARILLADAVSKGSTDWEVEDRIVTYGQDFGKYKVGVDLDEMERLRRQRRMLDPDHSDKRFDIVNDGDDLFPKLRLRESVFRVNVDSKDIELVLAPGYYVDEGTVYQEIGEDCAVELCPHLILPVAIYRNLAEDTEYVGIALNHDRAWHRVVLPKSEAYSGKGMKALIDKGALIEAGNQAAMIRFLQQTEYLSRKYLPIWTIAGHMGWESDFKSFVPYSGNTIYAKRGSFVNEFHSIYQKAGTLEGWLQTMQRIRNTEHVPERIAMATAFASVLIRPSEAFPFMLDVWGPAGIGKTTILMMAASIWGDPRMPGGYIGTFNSTDTAYEQLAMFCCDLPLLLDELQTIQNRRDFDTIIYKLCEGKPKGRGSASGGLQDQNTWHNTIIATGEQPIVSESSMGGAQRRVVNLKYDRPPFGGDKNEVARLRETIAQNYGVAGRAFVEKLLVPANMQRARKLVKEFRMQIAQAADGAQNIQGALILAADMLATEWIFGDDLLLTVEDVAEILKDDGQIDSNARAHEYLMQWLVANQTHILPERGAPSSNASPYGRYFRRGGKKTCAIMPDRFDRLMREGGFNGDAYKEWAAAHGKISLDGSRRTCNVPFKLGGKRKDIRCVCVFVDDEPATADESAGT